MRNRYALPLFIANCLIFNELCAQSTASEALGLVPDRLAYPIFSSCENEGLQPFEIKTCADAELLKLIARDVRYPDLAREKGAQGMVVIQFTVEKDGSTSGHALAKDIGWGCGEEAVRVLKNLEKKGLRWSPARVGPDPQASKVSVPVRFRLEEAKIWRLTDRRDTVFDRVSEQAFFKMGPDSLHSFIIHKTNYPSADRINCRTGHVSVELLIKKDGSVRIENVLDFHGLGLDFEFAAIQTANKLGGKHFQPAQLNGRPVNTVVELPIFFKSSANECAEANEKFDLAMVKADSALIIEERGEHQKAIEKAAESLDLAPENTEMLYFRGLWNFQNGEKDLACEDWAEVKKRLGLTWFEQIRRLACGR